MYDLHPLGPCDDLVTVCAVLRPVAMPISDASAIVEGASPAAGWHGVEMPPARATAVNATAAALLGLLHDGPMTGGQLVAAAGRRFGSFFSVTRSQVYRELPVLAEAGLLRLGKQGPRASQQYAITAAGRRSFKAWLAGGGGADPLRSPLVLRLLYAGSLTVKQRAELVRTSREAYSARLDAARATARGEADPYRKAVADFAVGHSRSMLKLLDAIPAE
jgi:DNA-binding PadR family transcriptional regulator